MDQILDTPPQEKFVANYAGFWIRVGASLIDGLLLWVVNVIISFLYIGTYSIYERNFELTVISWVLPILYNAFMESSERQGTLGKIALGLKVGDEYGNRISFANALGRYFAKFISAIILGIGYLMVAWDDKKQGLHDKIASTYVYEK